jgi:hypothetical protein
MKPIYLHVFYLTIIAFLGYNYWSSVQASKAFEHLDRQLNADNELMNNTALNIFKETSKSAKAYPNFFNLRNNVQSEITMNAAFSLKIFIDSSKTELLNNQSLTDARISLIKEKASQFSSNLIDSVNSKDDRADVLKSCYLPKLIADNAYWESIKMLPKNVAIANLSLLENAIKIDEITLLNYYYSKTGVRMMDEDYFKAAIAPKKAALIEGETFEADIYLAKYASGISNGMIIKVNGKPLEINQGVAHFVSKNQKIGTKTIKAEILIRNPLTGAYATTEGVFEYQVLPKCSRDCQ